MMPYRQAWARAVKMQSLRLPVQSENKMAFKLLVKGGGLLVAALLAGCALAPYEPDSVPLPDVAHFSTGQPGAALPGGWREWRCARHRSPVGNRWAV